MKTILRILKLLLITLCVMAAVIFALTNGWKVSDQSSESELGKILFLSACALLGLIAFWLFKGNVKENFELLVRPVPVLTWVIRTVGLCVLFLGFFLALGNLTGQFTTYPYLGTLVLFIGILIISSKGKING